MAPLSGTLSDRIGQRLPASIGIAVLTAGLLSLATLPPDFAIIDLVWRLALIGAGQGLFLSPNSSAILGSVPRPRLGTASGMIAQMRVVGQALGIVISAAVVALRLPAYLAALDRLPPGQARGEAFVMAAHDAFIVAALICSIGIAGQPPARRRPAGRRSAEQGTGGPTTPQAGARGRVGDSEAERRPAGQRPAERRSVPRAVSPLPDGPEASTIPLPRETETHRRPGVADEAPAGGGNLAFAAFRRVWS